VTLRVRFFRVRPEKVGRLRSWLEEVAHRRDEALETLANESVRHEAAWLLQTAEGPILVYAIEAEDLARVDGAFESSPFPIDHEHRRVMDEALIDPFPSEPLLDLRPDAAQ
jgi:hypothetical protein